MLKMLGRLRTAESEKTASENPVTNFEIQEISSHFHWVIPAQCTPNCSRIARAKKFLHVADKMRPDFFQ